MAAFDRHPLVTDLVLVTGADETAARAAAARWQERVLEPVPQEERERFLSYLSAVSLRAAALCSDPQESAEPEDGGPLP